MRNQIFYNGREFDRVEGERITGLVEKIPFKVHIIGEDKLPDLIIACMRGRVRGNYNLALDSSEETTLKSRIKIVSLSKEVLFNHFRKDIDEQGMVGSIDYTFLINKKTAQYSFYLYNSVENALRAEGK